MIPATIWGDFANVINSSRPYLPFTTLESENAKMNNRSFKGVGDITFIDTPSICYVPGVVVHSLRTNNSAQYC